MLNSFHFKRSFKINKVTAIQNSDGSTTVPNKNGDDVTFYPNKRLGVGGIAGSKYIADLPFFKEELIEKIFLKVIPIEETGIAALRREVETLKREGTLKFYAEDKEFIYIGQPLLTGYNLRDALYTQNGAYGEVSANKITLSDGNQLINDFDSSQIIHHIGGRRLAWVLDPTSTRHSLYPSIKNRVIKSLAGTTGTEEQAEELFNALQRLRENNLSPNDQLLIASKIREDIDPNALTTEDKDEIAFSLLRDYQALASQDTVHCDLKLENVMIDPQAKAAKIVDFGQAFKQSKGSPHQTFTTAGAMYMVPEGIIIQDGKAIANPTLKNSRATDLYILGVMIAALYSDNCYEREMSTALEANNTDSDMLPLAQFLLSRDLLKDVLGPEVTYKEGMPYNLFMIARQLTAIAPEQRPESITLPKRTTFSQKTPEKKSDMLYARKEAHHHLNRLQRMDSIRIYRNRALEAQVAKNIRP